MKNKIWGALIALFMIASPMIVRADPDCPFPLGKQFKIELGTGIVDHKIEITDSASAVEYQVEFDRPVIEGQLTKIWLVNPSTQEAVQEGYALQFAGTLYIWLLPPRAY